MSEAICKPFTGYGGYYGIPSAANGVIHGMRPAYRVPCGTYQKDGVQYDLFFIQWMKDFPHWLEDQDIERAEVKDMAADAVDSLYQSTVVQAILSGGSVSDLDIPESIKAIVEHDRSQGLTGEQIIEKRADLLTPEFLGFTFAEACAFSGCAQPVTVTDEQGNESISENVTRCSLEN